MYALTNNGFALASQTWKAKSSRSLRPKFPVCIKLHCHLGALACSDLIYQTEAEMCTAIRQPAEPSCLVEPDIMRAALPCP
jgi:hypothetical protein